MKELFGESLGAVIALMLVLLGVAAPQSASGQTGAVESALNVECLERLEMPIYPALPRQARIQAVQAIRLVLSDRGTPRTVESSLQTNPVAMPPSSSNTSDVVDLINKHFKESAEKALKNSQFSKTCGGKTVTLVFHYEIREDEIKSLFAFGPPNHFWVRAGPFYVNPKSQR